MISKVFMIPNILIGRSISLGKSPKILNLKLLLGRLLLFKKRKLLRLNHRFKKEWFLNLLSSLSNLLKIKRKKIFIIP